MRDASESSVHWLQDLDRLEHLLVWAFRAIAMGQGDCPLIAQTFDAACGPMGGQTLAAYFLIVQYIGSSGRRRLKMHAPGCPCITQDELAIVGAIAAAQASIRENDETLLRMRLRFLVQGEAGELIVFAAQQVARALEVSGHSLPLRLQSIMPPSTRVVGPQLIH